MKILVITLRYLHVWRFVYLLLSVLFVDSFFFMIFPILLILIPRVLSMNPISALGHSALSKKYGLNKPPPATMIRAQTPYSSPPQVMDKNSALCLPLPLCANSPELVANANYSDTPKSIDIKSSEEHLDSSSSPVITRECSRHSMKCFSRNFLFNQM